MIHTHRCWNHSPAHVAGGPLQPIGTHMSKLTNAFQAPRGKRIGRVGVLQSSKFRVTVAASGTLKDPTEDASWDNPTWQLPKRQITTQAHPPPPPQAPGSLPHKFTGSHVTCLVTSVWVKMCLMKPNLERNLQCQERAAASSISADR